MSQERQTTPLIQTKLHRPAVPQDYVPRPRLAVPRPPLPLSLVSAAAGYGKTTLVSHWVREGDTRTAWVSLDERDSDPRLFLRYVCASVRNALPSTMSATAGLMGTPNLPPISVLAATLINDLDRIDERLDLVLDDLHLVRGRPVLNLITEVLNHPPGNLHLITVSRRDPMLPIARLRARGQVHEIRTEDLRFTVAETESLLAGILGEEVGAPVAEGWTQGTEGWVTGLRLAALAERGGGEVPANPFERWKSRRNATEYLLQEVLDRQSPEVRLGLLRSSIPDRFCASLLDGLRLHEKEESDAALAGQDFIDRLMDAGLFVAGFESERSWHRFHDLFRELLRREVTIRYGDAALAEIHARASVWFENEGLVDEALHHALAAGNTDRAAQLVERHQQAAVSEDQWYTLDRWLSELPESLVRDRPPRRQARAWLHYYDFDIAAIPPILARIEELSGTNMAPDLGGDIAFFTGYCLYLQDDGARALECLEEALTGLLPKDHMFRGDAEIMFGLAGLMEGQSERVTRMLREWLGEASVRDTRSYTHLLSSFVFINLISGDLADAERWAERLREAALPSNYRYAIDWSDYCRGLIHLLRGELGPAVRFLRRATDQRYRHHQRVAVDAMSGLALAHQARGRPDAAAETLMLLREFVSAHSFWSILADSCEARLAILQGQPETALRLVEAAVHPPEAALFWFENRYLTRCRALIAEGSPARLMEAEELLQAYAELNESNHNTCQVIAVLALQAVASARQGKATMALTHLERALELAEPGGIVLPFVEQGAPMAGLLRKMLTAKTGDAEFIRHILKTLREVAVRRKSLPVASTARGPGLLTARQLEVLELLSYGLHRENIAERLTVSNETVKTHLKQIYRKLGVSDRKQAVEEARARGLIVTR